MDYIDNIVITFGEHCKDGEIVIYTKGLEYKM